METTTGWSSDSHRNFSLRGGNRRNGGVHLSLSGFLQAPISSLLEYTGVLRPVMSRSIQSENERSVDGGSGEASSASVRESGTSSVSDASGEGEVSIRIIGSGDQDSVNSGATGSPPISPLGVSVRERIDVVDGVVSEQNGIVGVGDRLSDDGEAGGSRTREGVPSPLSSSPRAFSDGSVRENESGNTRDESYQRYDIQQVARWIEQILPFSLLLLVVFIRQHLQGFFITIWIVAVMFKSNDILRKQTALKGERKLSFLAAFVVIFTVHVIGVYWWYRTDDLLYPLAMLPPKTIPPFWHAVFIILVNDTMVRQAAMVIKCVFLIYYKNSRARNYRRQGQILTLVEYLLLLYRALLPAPVWYKFFLNKDYGGFFSSLTTGLYLTFKLTSIVEKVQSFITALRALSRTEVQYGSYATPEQVISAGDLCAICQEKMHSPILLRCTHVFCEDCVSEWFERERTCPLCRALVKPAELRSFSDGSTSLFFQLF